MKLIFKWLLVLLLVLVGIYAATPAWLPYALNRQLPAGWQIEQVDAGYPGITGISLSALRMQGSLASTHITLAATGITFNYGDFKTTVDDMTLDVRLGDTGRTEFDPFDLDSLELPVMNLSGRVPQLSISSLRARLLHDQPGGTSTAEPLVLDFGSMNLVPGPDESYRLSTHLRFEAIPVAPGFFQLDVSRDAQALDIWFPADPGSPKWLSLQANQVVDANQRVTLIEAIFESSATEQEWLDTIVERGSGGLFKHIAGQMTVAAEFAGPSQQSIQRLSVQAESLQLLTDGESFNVKANLDAWRDALAIQVGLPEPAVISYQDENGRTDRLLGKLLPQAQRAPRTNVQAALRLASGSLFQLQPGEPAAIRFNGGLELKLDAEDESLVLKGDSLSIEMSDFHDPRSTVVEGVIHASWLADTAFTLTLPDLRLKTAGLRLAADISVKDGSLFSAGEGSLLSASLAEPATSADQINLRWQELNMHELSGTFFTEILGLKHISDGETWTGFDIGLDYQMLEGRKVEGSGTVNIDKGPRLPVKFSGNIDANRWTISLPPTNIGAAAVASLMRTAHLTLPKSFKLTDGQLGLQGNALIGDSLTATLILQGHELDASFNQSHAQNIGFSFNSALDSAVTIDGPIYIEKIELAGGVDLTGISAELNLSDTGTLTLKDIHADVFEGRLNLANLRYSGDSLAETLAELTHINLEKIFAYADISGLAGTGYLDLSLPVSQSPSGMVINNGSFISKGSGHIAYARQGIAAANIGMQALENFQYKQLSGTINYAADGQYQLAIRLEGSNPDLYDGYPVVFNLNITGAMPGLFESMFMTGSFEEAILNQVKSR